jgi:hypothetical protein
MPKELQSFAAFNASFTSTTPLFLMNIGTVVPQKSRYHSMPLYCLQSFYPSLDSCNGCTLNVPKNETPAYVAVRVNVWDAVAWCKIQDCTCHSTLSLQAHAEQVKGESIPASSDGIAGTLDGAFSAFRQFDLCKILIRHSFVGVHLPEMTQGASRVLECVYWALNTSKNLVPFLSLIIFAVTRLAKKSL